MNRLLLSIDVQRDLIEVRLNELRFNLSSHPGQETHDATQVVRLFFFGQHLTGMTLIDDPTAAVYTSISST